MAKKVTSIDIGSHSTRALTVQAGKHGLQVLRFAAAPAGDAAAALAQSGMALKGAVCGLAGRDMNLRYSQVPPTPDWQLRSLMDLEIQDLAAQAGGKLAADFNLLPPQDPEAGVDTVLLALAKDEALQRLEGEVRSAGGTVDGYVPNCVGLYNAFLKCGPVEPDTVVCLANIGHETIDIALVKGVDLLFVRNLSGGGKVLDDAIAAAFNVSARKAESLKADLLDLDPQSRGRYASGQAEKVTMAAGGAANAIIAGIQSSLAFCKAQTKIADLKLDKVLLSGGSSRLRGLRGMLREALRCPVELFDPFQNLDLAPLPPGEAEQLQAMRHEAVVALGLAAGRLDDSLYGLEILPESVRRRKQFREQTVFVIAAAAIAAVLLVMQAKSAGEKHTRAVAIGKTVEGQRRNSEDVNAAAEKIIEQNRIDRALVEDLQQKALPLQAALLSARAVQAHLPPQLWLRRFDVSSKAVGAQKRPIVTIDGSGKEMNGQNVGDEMTRFSTAIRSDPTMPPQGVKVASPAESTATVQFTVTIDFQAKGGQ